MQNLLDRISEEMGRAFAAAGYDAEFGRVTVSNRPDLCEYQCNGAMALAKREHKAPMIIAQEVKAALEAQGKGLIGTADAAAPGFLNLRLDEAALAAHLREMADAPRFGLEMPEKPATIIMDYGGPNVAKPLHVGHLRPAIIGEALKRIARYNGHNVIADIHLGDWGLQMGLVITEVKRRMPELPYFDPDYSGEYPKEFPLTVSDLEEIYPTASAKSKEDPAYYAEAMEATHRLQAGERGLRALWEGMLAISIADMKKSYEDLTVSFDLWNGESTVNDLIPAMVESMKKDGYAYESNGALVVDVAREDDTREVPPCIILKSDGAALYTTTDLATLLDREANYHPDEVLYVTDKRQEMHFLQVFRAARKCGIVPETTKLTHIGFGTVNGRDGKPFKTRDGGVMRLSALIGEIKETMLEKIREGTETENAEEVASIIAMAAIKYGDLSNQASKDYIFDIDKFTSFEGDTGPYLLYTMVRIKSILHRYEEAGGDLTACQVGPATSEAEKLLQECAARFAENIRAADTERAPHRLCAYIYELANAFNRFYHETRILTEEDAARKAGWIALLKLTLGIMNDSIDCLGFTAPERM